MCKRLLGALGLIALLAQPAAAGPIFTTDLSPSNLVPPLPIGSGLGESNASGTATIEFSDAIDGFTYELVLNLIETPLLQAHIHNAPAGENGPIIAFLFDLCAFPACGDSDIKIFGDNVVLQGAGSLAGGFGGTFADVLALIEAGEAYVNVHTEEFVPGELRGDFPAVPEPASGVLTGLALAALAFIRPLGRR